RQRRRQECQSSLISGQLPVAGKLVCSLPHDNWSWPDAWVSCLADKKPCPLKPFRLAFFEESGEAFAGGVGGAGRGAVGGPGGKQSRQMLADRFVEQAFGELQRFRGTVG